MVFPFTSLGISLPHTQSCPTVHCSRVKERIYYITYIDLTCAIQPVTQLTAVFILINGHIVVPSSSLWKFISVCFLCSLFTVYLKTFVCNSYFPDFHYSVLHCHYHMENGLLPSSRDHSSSHCQQQWLEFHLNFIWKPSAVLLLLLCPCRSLTPSKITPAADWCRPFCWNNTTVVSLCWGFWLGRDSIEWWLWCRRADALAISVYDLSLLCSPKETMTTVSRPDALCLAKRPFSQQTV